MGRLPPTALIRSKHSRTSASPAPWSAIALIDQEGRRNTFNIEIPYMGSLLAYNNFEGSYKGMNELQTEYEQQFGPGNYIPPVAPVYYSFRFMVGVGMLMIGGEFDLSAGVAVVTAALTASMISYELSANLWVGAILALVLMLAIGFVNGYLVVRTGIPSFLVTLSTFFMLQGINLGVTKKITGTVATKDITNIAGFDSLQAVFASQFRVGGVNVRVLVLWWLLFTALATWILLRTRLGNWIFAVGGEADAARAVGVPVIRTKIGLYLGVAFAAWISGQHLLFSYDVVQSGEGVGNELTYIIAAVIGGCLITGGYGSAIGSAVGAFIFGMTSKGIVYAEWNPDWFKFFLGAMLLLATLLNAWVRKRAEATS